jgi:hypothetical protein
MEKSMAYKWEPDNMQVCQLLFADLKREIKRWLIMRGVLTTARILSYLTNCAVSRDKQYICTKLVDSTNFHSLFTQSKICEQTPFQDYIFFNVFHIF